jgi:predicted Rdx family selenoprotein
MLRAAYVRLSLFSQLFFPYLQHWAQIRTICLTSLTPTLLPQRHSSFSPIFHLLTPYTRQTTDKRTQYAQELLSTFSLSLSEVALQPATGGVFIVEITTTTAPSASPEDNTNSTAPGPSTTTSDQPLTQKRVVLWDRKVDGGFPETKELKRRVRDVIQPGRDLGHVDRDYARGKSGGGGGGGGGEGSEGGEGEKEKAEGGKAEEVKKSEGGEERGKGEGNGEGKTCSVEGGGKCEDCE